MRDLRINLAFDIFLIFKDKLYALELNNSMQ